MKGLALCALWVVLSSAYAHGNAPLQEQDAPKSGSHKSEPSQEQRKPKSPVAPEKGKEPNGDSHNPPADEKSTLTKQNDYDYTLLGLVINGILTLVTLGIAVAGIIQAMAAKRSADAWMTGERAWIFAEAREMQVTVYEEGAMPVLTSFQYRFRNHGKTPGRITRRSVDFRPVKSLDELPFEPEYRVIQDYGTSQTPITAGQFDTVFMGIGSQFTRETGLRVARGESILCTYGFVEYLDIFDKLHESRFCYKYTVTQPPGVSGPCGALLKWGHPEYNKAT